jgi:alpha-acetolactate decarboxylase
MKHESVASGCWPLCLLAVAACSSSSAPSEQPAPTKAAALEGASPDLPVRGPAPAKVRWFGALHAIMHEGRTAGSVTLSDQVPGPHAWGLGALGALRGEVTVLDDVAWLALPQADGTAQVRRGDLGGADHEQTAALFVVAQVDSWDEVAVSKEVPWSQLDTFLGSALQARGFALDVPTPIRLEGTVSALRWHVIDGSKLTPGHGASHADHARSAVQGKLENSAVKLVGFYSTAHQGVFTHAGSSSHFHVVAEALGVSGHVDELHLTPGIRLLLPKPRAPAP